MGRYSSSDEEYNRKLKKKRKRRSRSGSSSDTKYSSTSKHKKSKRKHKHRSRSTSRSEDRYSKQERSVERGRRSRSRGRRSRSPERRRSRSLNRNRRSRSYSRGRRSRSDSRSRYSGRKRSSSPDRSRRSSSGSRSKSRSRRSSPDRRKVQGSGFLTTDSLSRSESNTLDSIPGFSDMTPAEQAQARLKMALRAAAMADGKLKEQAMTSQSLAMDPIDSRNFSDAVALIESDGFLPAAFKSSRTSRSYKDGKDGAIDHSSHDLAMFGAVGSSVIFSKTEPLDKTALDDNPESIFDASLLCDPEEKMKRWVQKLTIMRKKKLEGDVLPY